jgi:hypothetical protein
MEEDGSPCPARLTLSRMHVLRSSHRGIDIWLTVSGWIWVCYVLLAAAALALAL